MSASEVPLIFEAREAPPLAGRAGRYREAALAAPLQRHFGCVWTNFIPADHVGAISVVPDGCVDLLWRDGRLCVAGPDMTAATLLPRPGATIIGLRFLPGAARNWLGIPMSELVGLQVDLIDLWGAKATEISRRIEDVQSTEAKSALFQNELLRLAPDKDAPAGDAATVFNLLRNDLVDVGRKMSAILDRLDTSARTLRRRCHEHFGYGPKTLDRILRFQRLLSLAAASPRASLSGMAYEVGYADQAHMTREVRDLTGISPKALASQYAA